MSLHKNVGIGGLDQGLCLIPTAAPGLFEIPTDEAGLQTATIRFATFDPIRFKPARKTALPDFVAGNTETRELLAQFPYLACQTSKIMWHSEGVGVHVVEVTAQGAIFEHALPGSPVIAVSVAARGDYEVLPLVMFSGGGEITAARANVTLQLATITPGDGGTGYTAGDVISVAAGSYIITPAQILVNSVGMSGEITEAHLIFPGKYSGPYIGILLATGGTGSGASFHLGTPGWVLSSIDIVDGGSYSGVPIASLLGDFITQGALGSVSMGVGGLQGGTGLTLPFDPVTTVKDTVEIPVQTATSTNPPPGQTEAPRRVRACTLGLPPYNATHRPFHGGLQLDGQAVGVLPPQDGVTLNVGDLLIVNDGSFFASVFTVVALGSDTLTWRLQQAYIVGTHQYAVAEGTANTGLWQAGFDPGNPPSDPAHSYFTFVAGSAGSPPPVTYNVGFKVTVEYRAIELNFEYVAREFASDPRFLRNEYQLDIDGNIVIDPSTGRRMVLRIDSFSAVTQIADANGSITDGNTVAVDEVTWRASVRYIGTAAEFVQTPAGAYFNVRETATIKIVPILAGLVAPVIPQS